MHQRLMLVAAVAASIAGTAASQSNTVAGLDGNLSDISSPTVFGRRGAAKPFGEIGFASQNTMCNPGTIPIPWFAKPQTNHPKFGFIVARLTDDRMVQISDRSMCKHAFLSLNSNNGSCLPCSNPNASGNQMWVGCSDVYSAGNNGSRTDLGPADEIDPWLGTWTMVGSYFDRGDPDTGVSDGVQSPISAPDQVKNRVTIQEQDLVVPNSQFFYQIHLLHEGESVLNRGNNIRNRGVTFTSTTTTAGWSTLNVGNSQVGSVLTRWPGAQVNMGANGVDDGRMEVAVKVTGPTNGMWHYEYAVHNVDNARGVAALHIPVCTTARVQNIGFRDIDANPLNQWIASVSGGEIVWSAAASNSLRWNMLFNFWFDSDAAPIAGNVSFDEANPGPGAINFPVTSQVPGFVPNIWLGAGCGTPASSVYANGIATDNAGFALSVATTPATSVWLFGSFTPTTSTNGPCTIYLDTNSLQTLGIGAADSFGVVTFPLPVPTGFVGAMAVQAASLHLGAGAILGDFDLSNGLLARAGLTGCQ